MMKRNTLLLIMLLAAFSWPLAAQQQETQWFDEANEAYNAGRYDTALMLYEKILDADVESATLYYNMGNASYKRSDFSMAIYYYEKALKLDPGNDDIKTNLAIANLAIVDKIEPVPQSFISRGWQRLKALFSSDGWAKVSLVVFALLLLSAFLFFRGRRLALRKLGFFVGLFMLVATVLSVVFASQLKHEALHCDHAIIMSPTVNVKSQPNASSTDLFVLHEGSKVTILDQSSGWNKIRIANGSLGWLPEESMRPF